MTTQKNTHLSLLFHNLAQIYKHLAFSDSHMEGNLNLAVAHIFNNMFWDVPIPSRKSWSLQYSDTSANEDNPFRNHIR
jgi:hypothetical protein